MESLVIKIILGLATILYLFLYYEEVVDYVQIQTYGPLIKWQNISKDCICGKEPNCYAHPTDSALCGKCFETCYDGEIVEPTSPKTREEDELVFALSATYQDVNKLLVLIASIHRFYPSKKLFIFDKDNTTALTNQLVSIRNVEVIRIKSPGKIINNIYTPFYLQEILNRHSNVLWLAPDMEFHNVKLTEAAGFKSIESAITYISHDRSKKVASSGYRYYFPSTSSVLPGFPLTVLLKKNARSLIKWAEKCALTPECWKCENASESIEDCTWMVLYRVATDAKQLKSTEDFSNSIEKQSWAPPECDFYCTLYLISITFVVVLAVGALALILLKRATKKTN